MSTTELLSGLIRMTMEPSAEGMDVRGWACPDGHLHSASFVARCPRCAAATVETLFPGRGTVWSSTIVRIPVGDRAEGGPLAYVDLDDGPRILCRAERPVAPGARVRVVAADAQGAAVVEEVPA